MKIIQLTIGCFIFLMLIQSSCKKKPQPAANGTLLFHLHTNIENTEVDNYGDTFVLSGGRRIIVNLSQLYISGIQLIKSDGSIIDAPALNILKLQDNEVYTIGTVAEGVYKSVKFNVGLSSSTNASTPASSDATLNRPDMWFGASAQPGGFVFVNFRGSIDTATTPSNTNPLIPFNYKIGTNALLKNVLMPDQAYTVQANQSVEEHMIIDYSKLLSGVQLNAAANLSVITPADNAGALAIQIANNIPSAFKYE